MFFRCCYKKQLSYHCGYLEKKYRVTIRSYSKTYWKSIWYRGTSNAILPNNVQNHLKRVDINFSLVIHTYNDTSCKCRSIGYVNSVKYLGIIFDNGMTWNTYLTYIGKEFRSVSCLTYSTSQLVPIHVKKMRRHMVSWGTIYEYLL